MSNLIPPQFAEGVVASAIIQECLAWEGTPPVYYEIGPVLSAVAPPIDVQSGKDCFVIKSTHPEYGKVVYAVEHGSRRHRYDNNPYFMDMYRTKHNILNFLYPNIFPKIHEVHSRDDEIPYSFSIREYVESEARQPRLPAFIDFQAELRAKSQQFSKMGIRWDFDEAFFNFTFGHTENESAPSIYYLDKITRIESRWVIDWDMLRSEYLEKYPEGDVQHFEELIVEFQNVQQAFFSQSFLK